ncbi:MAG: NIPSNAP family protein [Alphaproteobacteria bacterium]|nr:NIPSNAP family protein [Alphaproteobacteria bacterium]
MIYEMRTVTLKAGAMPDFLALNRESRSILTEYGTIEGMWVTEIGALNRVWRLCSYDSHEDYRNRRAALAADTRWQNEYLSKVSQHLLNHETRIMNPVGPLQAPGGTGNIYEYRYYRTAPGSVARYASLMERSVAVRRKHVHDVGMWTTESGQPDEFSHMIAHSSLEARTSERAAMNADAEWVELHREMVPLLMDARCEIILPVSWSNLQ